MIGPTSNPPATLLGYHLTVDRTGKLVEIEADFNYPSKDRSKWHGTGGFTTVAQFAERADYDALVIHTPKEQSMSTKQTILQLLSLGPQTSYALGVATNRPQPSVRRSVATLRLDGYDIITRGHGVTAEYVLENTAGQVSATGQVQPAQSLADDLKDEYFDASYHEDEPSFDDEDDDFFGDDYGYDLEVDPFEDDIE